MKKLTQIIEENFLAKAVQGLGQTAATLGTGLAGAGLGALVGYDMGEPAEFEPVEGTGTEELDPNVGVYDFDPETLRNMAIGAGAGMLAGGYLGNRAAQGGPGQALAAGALGSGAAAAMAYAAGNDIPLENLIGEENLEKLKQSFNFEQQPETPLEYIEYYGEKGLDQAKEIGNEISQQIKGIF